MQILIQNHQRKIRVRITEIRRTIREILKELGLITGEISFLFVDNSGITLINKKYFGRDLPTDVIAFSQDFEGPSLNREIYNLGDVVISLEQAKLQAKRYAKTFTEELNLLIVHGILHLLGFDDLKPEAKKKMRAMEKIMLKRIG